MRQSTEVLGWRSLAVIRSGADFSTTSEGGVAMSRSVRTHQPRSRGFTLVEMLVVISVIVMLASLMLPAILMVREMARRVQCGNNLHNLALAATQFQISKGCLPASRTFWTDSAYQASPSMPASWT